MIPRICCGVETLHFAASLHDMMILFYQYSNFETISLIVLNVSITKFSVISSYFCFLIYSSK